MIGVFAALPEGRITAPSYHDTWQGGLATARRLSQDWGGVPIHTLGDIPAHSTGLLIIMDTPWDIHDDIPNPATRGNFGVGDDVIIYPRFLPNGIRDTLIELLAASDMDGHVETGCDDYRDGIYDGLYVRGYRYFTDQELIQTYDEGDFWKGQFKPETCRRLNPALITDVVCTECHKRGHFSGTCPTHRRPT